MNWFLIYSTAIFLDFVCFITAATGIGLVLNRFIAFMAGPMFAFWFFITGVKGWGWRLIAGNIAEEIPLIGDFLPMWTLAVFMIHKKNTSTVEEMSYQEQEA